MPHGRKRGQATRTGGIWVAAILAASLTACSAHSADPTRERPPLTTTQAQQLSLARFTTYRQGTVSLTARFTLQGTHVTLTGWVDYPASTAYALSTENGTPKNILQWDHSTLALQQITAPTAVEESTTTPPLPQPAVDGSWGKAAIDTSRSELQQILIVILSVGSDRPDNPQLVQQNGARYLRTAKLGGEDTNVYAVPPSAAEGGSSGASTGTSDASRDNVITYWIDKAGAIRQVAFTLAGGAHVTLTLTADPTGPSLQDPFAVSPGPGTAPKASPTASSQG